MPYNLNVFLKSQAINARQRTHTHTMSLSIQYHEVSRKLFWTSDFSIGFQFPHDIQQFTLAMYFEKKNTKKSISYRAAEMRRSESLQPIKWNSLFLPWEEFSKVLQSMEIGWSRFQHMIFMEFELKMTACLRSMHTTGSVSCCRHRSAYFGHVQNKTLIATQVK